MPVKTVTFICTGNTCRSVMAEKIFNRMLQEEGVSGAAAGSAGTAAMGHYSIYGDLKQVLEEKGIEHTGHIPSMVDNLIMKESDLVLAMTVSHLEYLKSRFPEYSDKVYLLSDYAEGRLSDIPDPLGRGIEAYRRAFDTIEGYLYKVKERFLK